MLNQELPASDKIETYDFPVDEPQNIAYLRGVYLRLSDFTAKPKKVPYHLSFLEHGGTAGEIILNAIDQIVPGITDPGLDEYQRRQMVKNATFAGMPLYQQGFWNVLLRVISGEAYLLGVDAGGYNSTPKSAPWVTITKLDGTGSRTSAISKPTPRPAARTPPCFIQGVGSESNGTPNASTMKKSIMKAAISAAMISR